MTGFIRINKRAGFAVIAAIILPAIFAACGYADIIYLKNGRSLEGFVKSQDEKSVEIEIKIGTIKLRKEEISQISKSTPEESQAIRQKWQMQKIEAEQKRLIEERRKELEPKKADFSSDARGIAVQVLLNKKVRALLMLDTGSSLVVITKEIASGLGIDVGKIEKKVKLVTADGRTANAAFVALESVSIEEAEAKNVDAAILLDGAQDAGFGDGLLGQSFLSKFNFKVDYKNSKLILEKLE